MPKAGTPTSTSEPSAASVASAAFLSLTGLTFGEFAPIAKALEAAAKRRTRVRNDVPCGWRGLRIYTTSYVLTLS